MADPPVKMEAHGATHPVQDSRGGAPWQRPAPRVKPRPSPDSPGADPFRLGFRYRLGTDAEGHEVVEQVPLSAEDLIYPQEGDVVADGYPHSNSLQPRADSLRRHLEKRGALMVTSNVVLVLRSDGRNCSPDIAVIAGEIDRSKIKRAVDLRKLGGRLIFALEMVSTSEKEIEDKDLEANVKRYAREQVPDYFTVYPVVESQVKDLVGRRLKKEGLGYDELDSDAQGRVYSKELDLFFQIDSVTKELVVIDAQTGQRLLLSDEEEAGRKEAEAERDAAHAERDAAHAERAQEAKARRQAEQRAEQEAQARQQAEGRLRRNVEDLCGLLGVEWSPERSIAVADMDLAELETLWAHLMDQRSWPSQ